MCRLQFVTVTYSTGSTFCAAGSGKQCPKGIVMLMFLQSHVPFFSCLFRSVARVTFDYDLGDLNLMQTTHSDVSISELVKVRCSMQWMRRRAHG